MEKEANQNNFSRPPTPPEGEGELKKKVESLLFSSGRLMSLEEMSSICRAAPEDIKKVAEELKKKYEDGQHSFMIVEEGNGYKMTVKNEYIDTVKRVVTETELSKTVMETLAVVAFKQPCIQSEVIRIRTNKAYDHLRELEELGYLTREKFGRTKKVKLTSKFFEYFDLPPDKIKEAFGSFEAVEKAIVEREEEAAKLREEIKLKQKETREQVKAENEKQEKEIEETLGKLKVYEEKPEKKDVNREVEGDKLGDLKVFEEEPQEEDESEDKSEESADKPEQADVKKELIPEDKGEQKDAEGYKKTMDFLNELDVKGTKRAMEILNEKENEGPKTPEEMKIEKKAQRIMQPEDSEDAKEEEGKDLLEAAVEEIEEDKEKLEKK